MNPRNNLGTFSKTYSTEFATRNCFFYSAAKAACVYCGTVFSWSRQKCFMSYYYLSVCHSLPALGLSNWRLTPSNTTCFFHNKRFFLQIGKKGKESITNGQSTKKFQWLKAWCQIYVRLASVVTSNSSTLVVWDLPKYHSEEEANWVVVPIL